MRATLKGATFLTLVGLAPMFVLSAGAADSTSETISNRLDKLQRIVEEQQKVIAEQQGRLSAVEQMLLSPEVQIKGLSGGQGGMQEATFVPGKRRSKLLQIQENEPVAPTTDEPVAPTTEEPVAPEGEQQSAPEVKEEAPAEPAEEGATQTADDGGVGDRPDKVEKPQEELLVDTGGVLLPPGLLQVEPFLDYTHTSSDRVNILGFTIFEAIVIGLIRVDQIERDIVRSGVNLRYGLFDRFQLESTIPVTYRRDTEILGVGTPGQAEVVTDGFNIGDIELAGAYQITSQQPWIPASVFRLRGRFPTGKSAFEINTRTVEVNDANRTVLEETPTGSGFYSVAPGITFIWRTDPVAFFGGTSYTINLPRDQGRFGDVDPGDTAEFFAGINVALSDRVGLNLSFVNQFTGATETNGIEQAGTDANDARVSIGASYGLAPDISILTSASIGLTQESPDFVFLVSTPLSLQLF